MCKAAQVDVIADEYGQGVTLTIEAGKYYRTRDGRKVGPMLKRNIDGQFYDESKSVTSYGWRGNGSYIDGVTGNIDLIAEWVDARTDDNAPPVAKQQEVELRRFKIGDKVRALVNYKWVKAGTVYIVTYLDDDGDVWLKNDVDQAYMTDSELELITSADENQKPVSHDGDVTLKITVDTAEINDAIKATLLRTKQGYGFEIARHGDYVWVDTGKKAPIVLKTADVQASA